jgi:Xaa-Pro aminopeptidase
LEVHDVTPDGPLVEGMVLTIEPGVYLPERRVGVRIEDDVLVTKRGPKVLSEGIVKGVKEIEGKMGR